MNTLKKIAALNTTIVLTLLAFTLHADELEAELPSIKIIESIKSSATNRNSLLTETCPNFPFCIPPIMPYNDILLIPNESRKCLG
mgnify:CR=1 FL=1